ncbi:TlpA family protein disulfide reductase [Patescibacteria group bacterium]|nr:TlpA family protein disulfide reductase [Patescibacteria group bacterium]
MKEEKKEGRFDKLFIIIIVILGIFGFYWVATQPAPNKSVDKKTEGITENFNKVSGALGIGDMAYDFSTEDSFGSKITLSEFRNKRPVLLVFWATWCGYCAKELPDMKEFVQKYQDRIQVIIIASGEEEKTVKEYIQEKDINFRIFLDKNRKIWSQYAVRGTPSHFLINIEGEINYLRPGLASKTDLEIMMTMVPKI